MLIRILLLSLPIAAFPSPAIDTDISFTPFISAEALSLTPLLHITPLSFRH